MVHLSKRLTQVAKYVEKGAILADIGSDHAYLPSYLVKKGKIQYAIAGEVVKGPYASAVKNVQREQVENQIDVRLGNGLQVISAEDQVDTVTIAGMGGALISKILEEGAGHLTGVQRLVTQPNIHADAVRRWAKENDWHMIDEEILEEDGKIYEIIVLEKGSNNYTEKELLLGPFLLQEKNAVFIKKWQHELNQWKSILQSIEKATHHPAVTEKREQLIEKITIVQEVLANETSNRG